jgi:hypothetical protein
MSLPSPPCHPDPSALSNPLILSLSKDNSSLTPIVIAPVILTLPHKEKDIGVWGTCSLLLVTCHLLLILTVIASHSDELRRIGRRGNLIAPCHPDPEFNTKRFKAL